MEMQKRRAGVIETMRDRQVESFHSAGGLGIRFLEQELTDGCPLRVWPRISGFLCLRSMASFPCLLMNLPSTCAPSQAQNV